MPVRTFITSYLSCLSCLIITLFGGVCSKSSEQKRPPKQVAVLSAAFEDVSFKSARGEHWHPASAGFTLVSGDVVSTGPGSRAEVQTRSPASLIRIGENTTFVLEQSDSAGVRAAGARLLRGSVWGSVKKLEAGEEFALNGPAVVNALQPATFRMEMQEGGWVGIYVYEGEVRVKRTAGETEKPDIRTLARGQGLLMPAGGPSRQTPIPSDDPWRRGWKSRREQVEEEPDTAVTQRIEEKQQRRREGR